MTTKRTLADVRENDWIRIVWREGGREDVTSFGFVTRRVGSEHLWLGAVRLLPQDRRLILTEYRPSWQSCLVVQDDSEMFWSRKVNSDVWGNGAEHLTTAELAERGEAIPVIYGDGRPAGQTVLGHKPKALEFEAPEQPDDLDDLDWDD